MGKNQISKSKAHIQFTEHSPGLNSTDSVVFQDSVLDFRIRY